MTGSTVSFEAVRVEKTLFKVISLDLLRETSNACLIFPKFGGGPEAPGGGGKGTPRGLPFFASFSSSFLGPWPFSQSFPLRY